MIASDGYLNGSGDAGNQSFKTAPDICDKTIALLGKLEIPFDPAVIEWRVTHLSKDRKRGLVVPYADQRAYTDRLNALLTPAGWTRKYTVQISPNFQRNRDQKTTAKVFVTCDLTIFTIGSHAATGEGWADEDNAGTGAEAQAFKRACSCFGLGRYLYRVTGVWVDLDDHKRPRTVPELAGWATPEGWLLGLRSQQEAEPQVAIPAAAPTRNGNKNRRSADIPSKDQLELVRRVEAMAEPLGRGLYRGLLKSVGRAWKPADIRDTETLRKLLESMQAADRDLRRLQAAVGMTGSEALVAILKSLNVKSPDKVENLQTLQKIVLALEAKAREAF